MVMLKEIPYKTQFYWKGQRYKQLIRPKNPPGKFTVVCGLAKGESDWIDMPGGRKVKPVVNIGE